MSRKDDLLYTVIRLLEKQEKSADTLNIIEQPIFYDGKEQTVPKLMEDISNEIGKD